MSDTNKAAPAGDRLAKVMARLGLCSRRDAEDWIRAGRVSVNGQPVKTPAFNVVPSDRITVDGATLAERQGTRVWLYHKPAGLVVTEKDPEGRPTIFEELERHGLPRVVSVGRLDINTEGLLLLTNDGGLKRVLELPSTGWLRRYRVRAFGSVTQAALDRLKDGIEIDGVKYGPIEATLEREQGSNVWLLVGLREGKNREVKNVLAELGLQVNRLIRVSFGPFQLGEIPIGGVETVKARVLKDQLGKRLAEEAGADFEAEMPGREPGELETQGAHRSNTATIGRHTFRFTDRAEGRKRELSQEERPVRHRPGGSEPMARGRRQPKSEEAPRGPTRHIHFDDGREPVVFEAKSKGRPAARDDRRSAGKPFDDRPKRDFADRPDRGNARGPRAAKDVERRPRSGKDIGDAPRRAARPAGAGKPYAKRPPREGADRSDRPFADRPPRRVGVEDSGRAFGDKPKRGFGAGPRRPEGASEGARAGGGAPRGSAKPFTRADGAPSGRRPRSGATQRAGRPAGEGGAPKRPRKPSAPRKPKA